MTTDRRAGAAALLFFASLASSIALAHTPTPVPATWAQVQALPKPAAGKRIAYGPGAKQFGELRLRKGRGPHPVAILLHGGCWQSMFNLDYLAPLADRLAREGVATWNLEYRGIGDVGGGWPGTFEDAAAGVAHLRVLAKANSLDLNRVVLVGHSAGGQLALWLAGLTVKNDSALLHAPGRLKVRGVLGLAAIADLRDYGSGAGHFDVVIPDAPASQAVQLAIHRLLGTP